MEKKKIKNLNAEEFLEIFGNKLNSIEKKLDNLGVEIKEKKEGLSEKQLPKDIQIPVSIFRGNISPAGVLTKYLKENLDLKFSEIAKLINRDQRTIGINYRFVANKKKIVIDKKYSVYVPIKIFSDRRLSILESLVNYFKEHKYKNSEIAEILNKDQRNIWTLYSRAKKKLS